jgi:hypothetical protein
MIVSVLLLLVPAWGSPPDKAVAAFGDGGGEAGRLSTSTDGAVVVAVTSQGRVTLLDLESWESRTVVPDGADAGAARCVARAAVAVPEAVAGSASPDAWSVVLGCSDGSLQLWSWDRLALAPVRTAAAPDGVALAGDPGAVVGLFDLGTQGVHALRRSDSGTLSSARYTVTATTITRGTPSGATASFPQGFELAAIHRAPGGAVVTLDHGRGRISQWNPGTGVVTPTLVTALQANPTDLSGSDSLNAYYVEESEGRVGQYQPNQVTLPFQILRSDLDSPSAVLFSQTDVANHLVVGEEGRVRVLPVGSGAELASFDVGFRLTDLVESGNHVVGGTSDGELAVLTSSPWIDGVRVEPASVASGETFTVTFRSDEPGTYAVDLGGDRVGSSTRLASGDVVAGAEVSVEVEADERFVQGANAVWIRVNGPGGDVGWVRRIVLRDDAPDSLRLRPSDVGFRDRTILLAFDVPDDDTATGYVLYASAAPFTAADHPTGGPEGVVGSITSPYTLPAADDSGVVRAEIRRVVNGQTYWLAVRPMDGTSEGPMSNVLSVTPRPTQTATGLAGEEGGPPCSTLPASGLGWALVLLAAASARRRGGAAALVGACVLAPASARAQDLAGAFRKDETPAWANFELRYGSFQFGDEAWSAVYGGSAGNMNLEAGLQLFRYGELDLGIGYLWSTGNTVGAGGARSGEQAFTEWMPLSLTGTFRLHIADEQPIVPFAGVGFSYVFFREGPLDSEGKYRDALVVNGSKLGWHWQVGGNILLDVLQPRRAAMLEARTGINDTWLTVEYRQTRLDPRGGIDLSGWNLSAGLKIDY